MTMRSKIKNSMMVQMLRNEHGGPMIEAAFILPLMLIFVLGLLEIMSYVDAKERMNKATTQIANLVSTIPPESVNNTAGLRAEFVGIVNDAANVISPYGAGVLIRFCEGATEVPGSRVTQTIAGKCGLVGGGPATATDIAGGCGGSTVANGQFVSVAVACAYQPMFASFGLFDVNQIINTQMTAHMRQNVF